MTLSPRARQLLDAHRAAETPPRESLERILNAVQQHPLTPPSPELDVDPGAIPAGGAPASGIVTKLAGSTGAKLLAAVVAVAVPAAFWLGSAGDEPSRPAPTPSTESAPRTTEPDVAPPAPSSPAPAAAPLQLSELPLSDAAPARPSGARSRRAARSEPELPPKTAPLPSSEAPATPPSPAPPREDTLAQEVALLAAANEALASGAPARALDILREHQRRFPASRLAESRAVTRALSLCAAGQRAEGRRAAEAILKARPSSAFAERLRSGCALK